MILVNRIGAILLLLVFVLLLNMACGGDSGTTPTATEEAEQEPAGQETQDAPDEPEAQDSTEEEGEKVLQWRNPPEMEIDSSKAYTAMFKMENGTEFVVELYADKVPVTVNNFVFLARQGYYDGTTFHRVIPGFMAQAGDPSGRDRAAPATPSTTSSIRTSPTLALGSSRWQMPGFGTGAAPTEASSSSRSRKPSISMASTRMARRRTAR